MRCFASSATAIFTPASAYFIVSRLFWVGSFLHATTSVQLAGSQPLGPGGLEGRAIRHKSHGGGQPLRQLSAQPLGGYRAAYSLKHMEQSAPPYSSGMN